VKTVLILICSIYMPIDHCDKRTAVDVIYRQVPFGNMGMAAQVEAIDAKLGPDVYHYQKIVASR